MCGYAGLIFSPQSFFAKDLNSKDKFFAAASRLKHRGNEPIRKETFNNLFLAHFRLAFQGLTTNVQPMFSQNKKWIITFNGEIYNFPKLRKKIQTEFDYSFQTKGDTEAILAGFLNYGQQIKDLIEGEFSFVISRTDGTEVFAMRDPYGVKPLFLAFEGVNTQIFSNAQEIYLFDTKSINFSSEIKGLMVEKKWDRNGFIKQFVGLYEPIKTPFQNIIQMPPNSFLYAKKSGDIYNTKIQIQNKSIRNLLTAVEKNDNELYGEFSKRLSRSVHNRMLSEVELGVYLSGGVDSRVIAYEASQYYLKHKISKKLKSFTISFKNEVFDEANESLAYAHKLNFLPHVLQILDKDLSYSYEHAVYHSENIQPYTNGAAKWWLSRFTGKYVKGVLTGDGADELFCGYPSFQYANWWKFALNNREEKNLFDKIAKVPIGQNWRDTVYAKKFLNESKDPWAAGSSSEGSGEDFIESLSIWGVPHPLFTQIKTIATALLGADEALKFLKEQRESVSSWFSFGLKKDEEFLTDPNNTLMLWQNYFCKTHLPVQVLNWVGDRMEMANTLEGRTPFLSLEIKNFIYNLKDNMLIRGFENKSILRRSYKSKIDSRFAMAPKKQFGAPFLIEEKDLQKHQQNILLKAKETNLFEEKAIKDLIFVLKDPAFKKKSSPHTYTHLQSALQTFISFSMIDESIVKEITPKRDLEYEEKVLVNQKVF
ncbi:asparagine synthetase B family protein [Fluviispira multicolorata]|uniref:asparagine synthase (glutamine-hydrolyzing) n=1 Tax=Fluviispira multicolorata TaxID=2654512 RepID=A0A833JFF1_9BACT|nr:asparagine synthase-related protein [Fluviispira multicolorata]KAB8033363.1 hypothetical protein GCL57_01290 [Fluviispira multicolorata]